MYFFLEFITLSKYTLYSDGDICRLFLWLMHFVQEITLLMLLEQAQVLFNVMTLVVSTFELCLKYSLSSINHR